MSDSRPPLVVVEPPRRPDPLGVLQRFLGTLALALAVALLGGLLLLVSSLAGLGGLGSDVRSAAERAGAVAGRAAQDVADRFDPAHPPRGQLVYDTEFDELRRVAVGEQLGRTGEYVVSLVEIRKREDARTPDEAQYATIRRQYTVPRETRILGQVVRTDRGEETYYLYKGEPFRLGRAFYKVNWVSIERQEIAIARYRHPDELVEPLKFEVD